MSVTLETSHGKLTFALFCDEAPRTSFNFLALAASGKYDGTLLHRNIPEFMIQGGDPSGSGKGGESVYGGHIDDEISPRLKFSSRGDLAMANAGPNTNGSQFFITYGKLAHLNGQYSLFGRLTSGHSTLDKLVRKLRLTWKEAVPTGKKHRPTEDIKIISVTINDNPLAEQGYTG